MDEFQQFKSLSKSQFPNHKKGWTNNVFKFEKDSKITCYLPAYLRLKVKNIVSLDLFTLTGEVNCTFILSIYYSGLEDDVVDFLTNSVEMAFHKSDSVILDEQNLEVIRKNDEDRKLMTFTIRKVIASQLEGHIFWSPFQTVDFIISTTLRSLRTTIDDKEYLFKFNLMDCDDIDTKFSLSEQSDFGVLQIANNQLETKYTNQFSYFALEKQSKKVKKTNQIDPPSETNGSQFFKNSKQKLVIEQELEPLNLAKTVKHFQQAHFVLPTYKKPSPAILTIYFPLLLLGVINIGIFYQDTSQSGKVMLNIGALLVSFIALIPTVRQNTAVSPTVSFTQILVFVESFTTILTLIHMITWRNETGFDEDMATDGLLIASVVITSFVALCIFVLILLHYFYWQHKYHRKKTEKKPFKFDHKNWYNKQCDKFFNDQFPRMEQHIVQFHATNVKRIQSREE